jgi:ribonuclease HIII
VSDAPYGEPTNDIPEDLEHLLDTWGAKVSTSRPISYGAQYRVTRGSDTATVNFFRTGKVSIQGKSSTLKELLEDWWLARTNLEADIARQQRPQELDGTPRVGTDEAGKGDYFGPLVVAGVRVLGERAARKLREIGARDSKTLSVSRATSLAPRIIESVGPENTRVVVLHPQEYETRRRASGDNVSKLLSEVNVQILDELKDEVELFVVDEFGKAASSHIGSQLPPGVRLVVRPGAEDDVAVASASILARARYLEEMEALSEEVGFELPRGATHVLEAARRVVEECGLEGLAGVAKVHFGTTARVLEASGKASG